MGNEGDIVTCIKNRDGLTLNKEYVILQVEKLTFYPALYNLLNDYGDYRTYSSENLKTIQERREKTIENLLED